MTAPVALVTGGARRVGAALVRALAARGYRVAIHYGSSAKEAEKLVEEIEGLAATGGGGAAFQANFEERHAPDALMQRVVAHFGRLDLLVNSAASFIRTPLETVTADEFDAVMAVNLRAPFLLSIRAMEAMRASAPLAQGSSGSTAVGHIINLADLAAFESWSQWLPHSMAKGGIVQMTQGMARAFGPFVRVNAIAPGVVLLPDDWSSESADALRSTTPLARHGAPADVVGAMHYLLDATFVTGETVLIDGGRLVRNRAP